MNTDDALLQIGESTAEAVSSVLQVFCGEEVTVGLVAGVPPGTHPLEGVSLPGIAAGVSYVDGVTGGNVFVMTITGARRLAASMMGEPFPQDIQTELTELELSAMGEAMNQMMSAGAVATSAVLDMEVEIAPPETTMLAAPADALNLFDVPRHVVTSQFAVCGEPCRLVQLIPNAFVVRMTRALDEITKEYEIGPLSQSLRGVPVRVWAELGRAPMAVSRLVSLPAGAVVELDREADDAVDIYVDDMAFATGRLIVTDEAEWAVRIETIHGEPVPPDLEAPHPQPELAGG